MRTQHIDWSRLAEPQDDEYDTDVAIAIAQEEQGWSKPQQVEPPAFCDGAVGLRSWPDGAVPNVPTPSLSPGEFDHPNLFRAETYVKTAWPTAYRQFKRLIAGVFPMQVDCNEGAGGSCSGHLPDHPLTIYVTYFDPFGTAEGMLHEMAHIKLRCLGVQVENCSRLILNSPSKLYVSPLRSFKRPMTAVVHAFYASLHFTELGLRLVEQERPRALSRLGRNYAWIEQMAAEIRTNLRADPEGEAFFASLFRWADILLSRSRTLLEAR